MKAENLKAKIFKTTMHWDCMVLDSTMQPKRSFSRSIEHLLLDIFTENFSAPVSITAGVSPVMHWCTADYGSETIAPLGASPNQPISHPLASAFE